MSETEKIVKFIKKNNGIVTAKQVNDMGINSKILTRMISKNLIERVANGVYIDSNEIEDKYFTAQKICKKGVYSNDTALYLHGLSERTPLQLTFTIPSGYNTRLLKDKMYKFFYIKNELIDLGKIEMKTPYGNIVEVYDIERTICDIIKNKNKLDISIVTDAIKNYFKSESTDLIKLHKYAKKLNIEERVNEYLEVLL